MSDYNRKYIPVSAEVFTEPSGGYGVKAWRKDELPQVVMPTRLTKTTEGGEVVGCEAKVTTTRTFTKWEARHVANEIMRLQPLNLSELRMEVLSWLN